MTKKDFIKLIQTHREIFNCVALINATVRYDYPFMSVAIGWKTNNHRTIVKTFKGKQDDKKSLNELEKYKKWADEALTNPQQ